MTTRRTILVALVAALAVASLALLALSRPTNQEQTDAPEKASSSVADKPIPAAQLHVGRWTEADLDRLIARREKLGGPFTPSEVADLRSAANDGVLTAHYVLYHHEEMDGNPSRAEELRRKCVQVGEANCLVLEAGILHIKGLKEPIKTERIKYLTDAKRMLEASLHRSSTLMVARPSTVREQISEVEQALEDETIKRCGA